MVDLPLPVRDCLLSMRKLHDDYLEVKLIKGHYYLFKVNWSWNKKSKKESKITHYLGGISEDGTFVEAKHRNKEQPQKEKSQIEVQASIRSKHDVAILTNLSMNGRMPIPKLAKNVGLSLTATRYQVERIEKKYDLRYIAEIDTEKLGYLSYISFVKFKNKLPDPNEIKKVLEENPLVQLVLVTKGKYDLAVYFLAKSNKEIAEFIYKLQSYTVFSKYTAKWYTTPLFKSYNFIPLRDRFFGLLKGQIRERNKNKQSAQDGKILSNREYILLKELNLNGNVKFSDVDSKYGLNHGTCQYTYQRLIEKQIIERITISIKPSFIKYDAILSMYIINGKKFFDTRHNLLSEIIADCEFTNKYSLVGDTETPHGVLFMLPVTHGGQIEQTEKEITDKVKGITLNALVITNILVGNSCYRLFDKTYSIQYQALANVYKTVRLQKEKTDYD